MRVVISEFITLDGVVQAPGGEDEDTDGGFRHGGWSMPYFDPDAMGTALGDAMSNVDALLYGRRTWQGMAAAWPHMTNDPFADHMNSVKKYVVSQTLTQADLTWNNSTLIATNDVITAVSELRDSPGRDLCVVGSASLAKTLIAADLVDELNLMIEPILVGGGKTIFPADGARRPMKLVSTTTAATGVLICTYQPAP
jgi:dihydrofolate reductase